MAARKPLVLVSGLPSELPTVDTLVASNLSGNNTGDQFTGVTSSRFLGRVTAGFGAAEELTGTQATVLLDAFSSTLKGLAPASAGGTANFLRADGSWMPPPSGGGTVVVTKTASYTETATSGVLVALCNLAAGFTATLPTAVGNTGTFTFKKMLAAGVITVATTSAQTIDGGATAALNNQYESITLVSDNANWAII